MATKPKAAKPGQTPKPIQKGKPSGTKTTNGKESGVKSGAITNPRTKGKPARSRTVKTYTETPGELASVEVSNATPTLVDVSNARVTQDEITSSAVVFPYSQDYYELQAKLYPAGDATGSNSAARSYFEIATGVKLLTDINIALKKSNSVTITDVADYINTVSQAYHFLLRTRNHINLCYSAVYHEGLRNRLDNIYNESIPPLHMQLSAALRAHFLPRSTIALIERMSHAYYSHDNAQAPILQFAPHGRFNVVSAFTAEYVNQINALGAINNVVDIITAFASDRYPATTIKVERLAPDTTINDARTFLQPYVAKLDNSFFNVWMNFPLVGFSGASTRFTYTDVADLVTNFTKFSSPNRFDFAENALTPRYITSESRHEPGILEPIPSSGANDSALSYFGSGGNLAASSNTGFSSYAFGALSMNGHYAYNQTDQVAIRVHGTSLVQTNGREVNQDAYKLVRSLNDISMMG